jgi:hypothetical protein
MHCYTTEPRGRRECGGGRCDFSSVAPVHKPHVRYPKLILTTLPLTLTLLLQNLAAAVNVEEGDATSPLSQYFRFVTLCDVYVYVYVCVFVFVFLCVCDFSTVLILQVLNAM